MDVGFVDRKQNRAHNNRHNAHSVEDKFGGGKMGVCEEICAHKQCANDKVHCKGYHTELAKVDKGQHKGKHNKAKTGGVYCIPCHVACEEGYARATGDDDNIDGAVVNLAHGGF